MSIINDSGVKYVEIDGKRVWEKPDSNGWMPVETAPKDGTPILLSGVYMWETYEQFSQDGIVVGCFNDAYKDWIIVTSGPDACTVRPTHWMPLPDPPQ